MITFLDRSNQYASNVFYDSSNLYINAGDLTLQKVAVANGAGVVYTRTIGASIDTTFLSAYYNLNFAPVDGDIVELPTVWQGSMISVSPAGYITVVPALPSGTQVPRRSYQVSTGTWFQDTITLNDSAGIGVLSLPQVTISAAGRAIPRTTGDAALALSPVSVAGAGYAVPNAIGTGALSVPQVSTSGAGNTIPRTLGVGAVSVPSVSVAGSGNTIPRTLGDGALNTPQVSIAGVGAVSLIIPGSASLNLPQVSTAGAGSVFEVVVGSGSLAVAPVSVSGLGSATATTDGVASLFLQSVSVSGQGSVTTTDLPYIIDNGNLSVIIPHYGQSVCVDYPTIAAWLTGFSSNAKILNDLPLLPLAINSPISVTFKASNQFGTTTLQRTLTIIVAEATANLQPNQADLRLAFPYFQDLILFSYQSLDQAIQAAMYQLPPTQYGRLQGAARLRAIYLMAAHMLFIQRQASVGGAPGVVLSATIDKVSVQSMAPPTKSMWSYWLSKSPYGTELQGLLSAKSAGGFYIPGSSERSGFRKSGGGF